MGMPHFGQVTSNISLAPKTGHHPESTEQNQSSCGNCVAMSVPEPSDSPAPPTIFVKTPVVGATATTDQGRTFDLFRYEAVVLSPTSQPIALTTEQAQKAFLRS